MINRRYILSVVTIALLACGSGGRPADAADLGTTADWRGKSLGRRFNTDPLTAKLRTFFGKATGTLVPASGRYLSDQFNIGMFDEYMLPDAQVIAVQSYGRLAIETVAVLSDPDLITFVEPDNTQVLATAFLTNLCPKGGVDENFTTSKGGHYSQHFTCELDYSLAIFYARGSAPVPRINLDLINWAKADIAARHSWAVPDRQLLLKTFVRVLNDGRVDVNLPDNTFPVRVMAESF